MSYKLSDGWLCCRNTETESERLQEQAAKKFQRHTTRATFGSPTHRDINARPLTNLPVYSFKEHQIRILSDEKVATAQNTTLRTVKSNQKMISCLPLRKQNQYPNPVYMPRSPPQSIQQLYSPRMISARQTVSPHLQIKPTRLEYRISPQSHCQNFVSRAPSSTIIKNTKSPSSKLSSNIYSLKIQAERPTLKFNPKIIESKIKGKRIRTAEEQTQYSSKHSQIHFRNSYEGSESTNCHSFQKKNYVGQGNFRSSVFQEDCQKFQFNQQIQFPSCKQVSACEEFDHSISNQFLRNARSINSIVTSTEMKSKRTSRQPSNHMNFRLLQNITPCLSPRESQGTPQNLTMRNQLSDTNKQERFSTRCPTKSPRAYISPVRKTSLGDVEQQLQGSRINSSIFYVDEKHRQTLDPKKVSYLSVLNINDEESSQQQELKDVVVEDDINISKGFSGDNSIFASARQSFKNVEDLKIFLLCQEIQKIPEEQLLMLKGIRSRQQRTNTILSMESVQSQNSCLDIKFMQKHKNRREVSKLIRE